MEFIRNNEFIRLYLISINIISFGAYALDKWKAIHGQWRISEKTLMGLAVVGESMK